LFLTEVGEEFKNFATRYGIPMKEDNRGHMSGISTVTMRRGRTATASKGSRDYKTAAIMHRMATKDLSVKDQLKLKQEKFKPNATVDVSFSAHDYTHFCNTTL